MRTVQTLIDEAAAKCGTYSALADRLGIARSVVSEWRSHERAVSPEAIAQLCDVLELPGEEARRLLAVSILENPKNKAKASVIRRAFFVSWVCGSVALVTPNESQATRALNGNLAVKSFPGETALTVTQPTLYTLSRMSNDLLRATRAFFALMARSVRQAVRGLVPA
jgi:hypothetical protein